MENNDQQQVVKADKVVTLDYSLRVDGDLIDSSEGGQPIQFLQGHGQIIPGLERELNGMSVGESKEVVVSPEQGYGEVDEEAFAEVPRREFPPNVPLEPGISLQLRDEDGNIVDAYIESVSANNVRLNLNHPLAGKELHFEVTVVDLRDATKEELDHGHVHGEAEDEDWEEDEDWDEEDEDWDDEEDEDWEDDDEDWDDEEDEDWDDDDED